MAQNDFDVLILGAGLSGIGAACHLTRKLKKKSYAILERRKAIGGTWDLFRYPGIRSDSDMTTFGYNFRPWRASQVLADGESIRNYVTETAEKYEVIPNIRFGRKVVSAAWSSKDARWTVKTHDEDTGEEETWTAQYVIGATGYYNYDEGFSPKFPGEKKFKGQIIHPQHWPENLEVFGKKVVVIGSGATAITLVPSLSKMGANVTMLQRTPTYVLSIPAIDPLWHALSKVLPIRAVYAATRTRNIALQRTLYMTAKQRPKAVRRFLSQQAKMRLGKNVDVKHFLPNYNPWDQRLCVVPDGDLFQVLRTGEAKIFTDNIKTFDQSGIELVSGEHLDADIIVTATGLNLQLSGGAKVTVDGEPLKMKERMLYKGMMIEGVPNLLTIIGYTNASWTLKSDIVTEHFCRIIRHMDKSGSKIVSPQPVSAKKLEDTVMGSLQSGYVARGADILPRQGSTAPWVLLNDYTRDAAKLKFGKLTSKDLQFS